MRESNEAFQLNMLKNSGWVGDENISAMRKTAGSGLYRAPSWVVFGRGRGGWGWEIQQKLQLNKKMFIGKVAAANNKKQ